MRKAKALRIAGFVGALGASAALITAAVQGTGAYFTDSHNGEIDASTGHVNVTITPSDGKLAFTNLLPGDYKDVNLDYTAHGDERGRHLAGVPDWRQLGRVHRHTGGPEPAVPSVGTATSH